MNPTGAFEDGTARINALLAGQLEAVIPAGVYVITGPLQPRDGQVISAQADGQVTLKAARGYSGGIISAAEVRFTMRGFTFDGSYGERLSSEGDENAAIIHLTGCGGVVLEANTFLYAPSFAVWCYRCGQIRISGNNFVECQHAIRVDGDNLPQGAGVIENNRFTNTAGYRSMQHLTALNTVGLVVRGNTMTGAGLGEPTVHDAEGTWGNSIYLFKSTGYLVESNQVSGNHWSALVSGQQATNGIVRNNTFGDGLATPNAMWIEQPGADNITVEKNQLDGGILLGDAGGDHVAITNNTIRSRAVGIDVSYAARHVTIAGNTISRKGASRYENGIYLWDKSTPDVSVDVANNTITGFDKAIAINNPGARGEVYGIRLRSNTFSSNNVDVWVPDTLTLNQLPGQ